MTVFAPIITTRHYISKIRALRAHMRTARMIASLPPSIQKDIGWPDSHEEFRGRRGRS
jgi:hypothetical protein